MGVGGGVGGGGGGGGGGGCWVIWDAKMLMWYHCYG